MREAMAHRPFASCRRLLATALGLAAATVGCASADVGSEGPSTGIQGQLSVRVADYDDKTTSTHYFLEARTGEQYELLFKDDAAPEPGAQIEVKGDIESGDFSRRIVVRSYSRLQSTAGAVAEHQDALVNATTRADYKVAVLMVHWGQPDSQTVASLRGKVFTNADSTSEYYREASYGIQKLSGDVFGWYSIPNPGSCDANAIATSARNAASAAGVNLAAYKQIMYYFPKYSCAWAGLAQIGSPSSPARDSWYNGYSACVVLNQEIAHNWGLLHSHSCTNQPASGTCAPQNASEYGDPFCPMGGGCWQLNAVQKGEMGWFGACNVVSAPSGGTFDIAPFETASNGIQALRVPKGDGRYFYVENRRPLGKFDVMRSSSALNTVFNGVLIHEGPQQLSPQPSMSTRSPYLMDANPGTSTFDDAALQIGRTWTNGSVSITLISKDASGNAKVQVSAAGSGGPVCLDGTALGSSSACSGITVFQHTNYGGYAVTLPVGDYTTASMNARGIVNNDISSVQVPAGCSVTLYDGDNFSGISLGKSSDDPSLVDDTRSGGNWNDLMSSLRVR